MTLVETLAAFVHETRFDHLPERVVEVSKTALLDYLAVTLAAVEEPAAVATRRMARSSGGPLEARILGTSQWAALPSAVLANATTGHALDFDDTNWTQIGHPTTVVAPVCLAVADGRPVSGRAFIAAYAAGVEVLCKLSALSMPETSQNGWHTTSVYGPFGAAAAYGYLKGMPPSVLGQALGIAASTAGGMKAQFGSMMKPLHAGWSAHSGVLAARLAESGITSSAAVLEGEDGFFQSFMKGNPGQRALNLADPWDLDSPGLAFKCYPSCSGTHPALDCLLDLLKETPFSHGDVRRIRAGVSLLSPKELIYHRPTRASEAKFSMEYAIAGAIVFGKMGLAQYRDSCVTDPRVQALMERVDYEIDEELAKLGFVGTAPVRITVALKDGRRFDIGSDLARGNPEKPLTEAEMVAKFTACTEHCLSPERRERAVEMVLGLEGMEDIRGLLAILG